MADDLFIAFDNFDNFFLTSDHKLLPVANPFETYNEMKFWECFVLSKSIIDEVNVKLHLFVKFILLHS